MAQLRENGTYIWVTWLSKLLVGEHSCEWAAWFRSHHESWSWAKAPATFDQVGWQMAHTAAMARPRMAWEEKGYAVFVEGQNSFYLRGRSATLGGKADLVAVKGDVGTVIDVKTGQPSPAHCAQVLVYMYSLPRALKQYRGIRFSGVVAYPDADVEIPAEAVDERFVGQMAALIGRIAADAPARRVPSYRECLHCPITAADCPERVAEASSSQGETKDF